MGIGPIGLKCARARNMKNNLLFLMKKNEDKYSLFFIEVLGQWLEIIISESTKLSAYNCVRNVYV